MKVKFKSSEGYSYTNIENGSVIFYARPSEDEAESTEKNGHIEYDFYGERYVIDYGHLIEENQRLEQLCIALESRVADLEREVSYLQSEPGAIHPQDYVTAFSTEKVFNDDTGLYQDSSVLVLEYKNSKDVDIKLDPQPDEEESGEGE